MDSSVGVPTEETVADASRDLQRGKHAPVPNETVPATVALQERVNQTVAHYLMTLTVDDIKPHNPTSQHHCKTAEDFEKALQKLKVFLASIVGKEDGVRRVYKHASGKDFGRMFCFKGLQNVWRAFRGALCKGLMTDIDMKNCHPVILLWLCDKLGIDCPKLREYVGRREHHLSELGKATDGKDREACKRLFLMATNTNKKLKGIPYAFFNAYQKEIQDTIQPALMKRKELARFKPFAEEAAKRKEAQGGAGNEEGSFLNLVLCFSENELLQEAKACLDEMEIETAVLSFDGLLAYGDHYEHRGLLLLLHNRLKAKFGIDMHFDFKQHETTLLERMPEDFDPTVVLGDEWNGLLRNIDDEHLRDATGSWRVFAGCRGQGTTDGNLATWKYAARELWKRAGRGEDDGGFEQAWAAAESPNHDGNTLRHYSRACNEERHLWICKRALELGGCTSFKETQLRDYFLKVVGDDVLCLDAHKDYCIWNRGRWVEDTGNVMANKLMNVAHALFQGTLSFYEKKYDKRVADGRGDSEEAKEALGKLKAITNTALQYGNSKNQNVLALIKQHLRAHSRRDDPFDNQPYVFAFTDWAYDLTHRRGDGGWFTPDKYDYLLMSCKKPWREPTVAEIAKVASWFDAIFPDEAMRRAYISILKSGMSGERFEYFFVATGGGRNGKGLLNEHFMHLLDMNGYAVVGHLDLLTKPIKSGANSEARSLHKKRFVRFSEPNPEEAGEAIRLSNVNELTGNEQLNARTGHDFSALGSDTRLHATDVLECNDLPNCKGDKGDCSQERWRLIPFTTKFTDDKTELASDPVRFRPKDPTLKSPDAKKQHYCALFKYLITAEGVWEPGTSLDAYMPERTKTMAREYLAKNDELSTWFLDQYEEENKVDAGGGVVNFVPIKEITALYQSMPIYMSMRKEDQRRFNTKKLKEDLEKNMLLKRYFKPAMKVRLASTKKPNTREGIIHFKRKLEHDDDDDGVPAAQRPRRSAGAGPSCSLNDQFGD